MIQALPRLRRPSLVVAVALAALAGCQRQDEHAFGVADLTGSAPQADPHAEDDGGQGPAAASAATPADADASAAGRLALADATNAVADAALTADVNAQLARDPQLAAAQIDVDTVNGRVVLHGAVPDAAARDRAARLAATVPGVVSVENLLAVTRPGEGDAAPPQVSALPAGGAPDTARPGSSG